MGLTSDILSFAKKALSASEGVIVEVRTEVSDSIINKTPLDTGYARGNWQASIGQPILSEVTRYDREAGFAPTSGSGIAFDEAEDIAKRDVDKDFYLTNNAEYIRNLEFYSGSKQAPHGMVRITIADFPNIVEKAIRNNRK